MDLLLACWVRCPDCQLLQKLLIVSFSLYTRMQARRHFLTGAPPLILLLFLSLPSTIHAHNITQLLAKQPEFSTFNHYLSTTLLAAQINQRTTITVCVVDNAAMNDLLAKKLSIYSLKNALSLHVLLDYFDAEKLHQIANGIVLAATIFQATGSAPGSSGFVNITDLKGGKVGFAPEDNGGTVDSFFVKSVEEIPYNISVIQISKTLPSNVAEAPSPSPGQLNLTGLMSTNGCKAFAETLMASDAEKVFEGNVEGGLTVFCPLDDVFNAFLPKYKNLTAAGKTSLLEYHGVPIFMSMSILKSNNGVTTTLATDGANSYEFTVQNDGEEVTIKTNIATAKIVGTIFDQLPLVIFKIDKILEPKQLFKAVAPTSSPAPTPAPELKNATDSPKGASSPASQSPADSPADQNTDGDAAIRVNAGKFDLPVAALSVWLGFLLL